MTEDERLFLLAEYDQAWAMILNIDERRSKFVEYYSAVFTAVVAVVAGVISQVGQPDLRTTSALSVLLAVAVGVGLSCRSILLSEREANKRYRRKVNVLRSVFLDGATDDRIKNYLERRREFGAMLASDPQPKGVGSTLTGVLRVLWIQISLLGLSIPALWAVASLPG